LRNKLLAISFVVCGALSVSALLLYFGQANLIEKTTQKNVLTGEQQRYLHAETQRFLSAPEESRSVTQLGNALKQLFENTSDPLPVRMEAVPVPLTEKEVLMLLTLYQTLPTDSALTLPPFIESLPLTSLTNFVKSSDTFQLGVLSVYAQLEQQHVFAYRLRHKNDNAYVVFNFSYDTHEVPLPFGFMASTKVRVWRTDDMQVREFVTRHALSIRPFTAMVILV